MKIFLIFIELIVGLFYLSKPISATATYPIPELGSCRDTRECQLYCEIPANKPACWSYDKYVLRKDVLGDAAVNISFPITELGNCASAAECFVYCNQPQNQPACLAFARKNGLVKQTSAVEPAPPAEILSAAKTELGCDSKETCMAMCNDSANMDKCRSFARKHGLEKENDQEDKVSDDILQKAKAQLGCDSRDSCEKFCKSPDNQSKCFDFAKQNGLMKKEETDRMEKTMEARKKMLETAKEQLFCDSFETCAKLCSNPDNRDKCQKVARQFEMVTTSGQGGGQGGSQQINNQGMANQAGPGGCKTEEECNKFCREHPSQCPGFPKPSGTAPKPQSAQNFSPSMPPFNPNQNFKPAGGQFPPPSGFQQPIQQSIQQSGGSFNLPPPNPSQYPDR